MAAQPPGDLRPNGRPDRRQQAPSLDVMAAQSSAAATLLQAEDSESGAVSAMQESRSSSSTNSPLPNDNEESDFFLVANDSESSLGVSNLQDMQVTDAEDEEEDLCIPPVNRLPNEILISIFAKLSASSDLLHCMLACKRWARNSVDLLWHRPACTVWSRHESICRTLGFPDQYFSYKDFIKRLNLASIADKVNDGSVLPLAVCNRIERLTLTNCKRLTDTGLIPLVENSHHLLALDISGDDQITEATIFAIAEHCRRLQGLNVSGCTKIANEGMIKLAESCKYIKRIKLNDCGQLTDDAVLAFAQHCPNILEIDLHQCRLVSNQPVTDLLARGQALRELRLTNCELVDDGAFLSLPDDRRYEHLRILDLTSCVRLTDRAVERITAVAPRLRNLVLAKCRNITDLAVHAIARLGKNLHYVHLGHCSQITDEAVKRLVHSCNRIRYIDLGCCVHLTDDSVTRLATLPKLKRIGLVKCSSITDESVYALARANQRHRQRRDADGNAIENQYYSHSSLERVHLSYCTNLSIRSIIRLLNACHRLTHLSLTGVPAFLREDLSRFCRSPPPEFTMHQREVFCVFSGDGVAELREHLNTQPGYASYRDRPQVATALPTHHRNMVEFQEAGLDGTNGLLNFDEAEADVPDDDDGLDGSEMILDPQILNLGPALPPPPILVPPPVQGGGGPLPPGAAAASTLLPTAPPFLPGVGGGFVQLVRFPEHHHTHHHVGQPHTSHPTNPLITVVNENDVFEEAGEASGATNGVTNGVHVNGVVNGVLYDGHGSQSVTPSPSTASTAHTRLPLYFRGREPQAGGPSTAAAAAAGASSSSSGSYPQQQYPEEVHVGASAASLIGHPLPSTTARHRELEPPNGGGLDGESGSISSAGDN